MNEENRFLTGVSKFRASFFQHYRKLWFFNFHRFESGNYQAMGEYFAHVMIGEIEPYVRMEGKKALDVGGARGEFCKELHKQKKCNAINLDPNPKDYIWPDTKVGSAEAIPFDDNFFDLVICRNVLEHIPDDLQQQSLNEMYRVTKSGGVCYVVIPPWFNPHAGHYLKPFHVLPFRFAKFLREMFFRKKVPGNSLEDLGLYKVTFRKMRKMIRVSGFDILATKDTHFRLHLVTKIPLLREFVVPAVSFLLRKK